MPAGQLYYDSGNIDQIVVLQNLMVDPRRQVMQVDKIRVVGFKKYN